MKCFSLIVLCLAAISLNGCATSTPQLTSESSVRISPEIEPYLIRGISAFKTGRYQDAIANYNKALVIEPDHTIALYELALTYMTLHRNDECIVTAEKALERRSDTEVKLLAILGSCHSQAGNYAKALAAYRSALKLNANDSSVHFNIAVAHAKKNQDDKAVYHLQKSIEIDPGYASPYLVLAEMHRRNNRSVEAIFMFMKFAKLEGNTDRTIVAASSIFTLPYGGVDFQKNAVQMNLEDNTPFSTLTLGLRLIAIKSASDKHPTKVSRHVAVISDLVELAGSFGNSDRKFRKQFLWNQAMKEFAALQASDDLDTFLYVLAEKAGIDGASKWLQKNANQVQRLAGLLN